MYSIGKFSKICGLTTKTLIWYDNIGLLKPVYVDENNNYRYYDNTSLEKIIAIKYWQELGFSINEIKNLNSQIIDRKIKELACKADFYNSNIDFLLKFKEGNMNFIEISQSEAYKALILGKWRYEGSTKDFKDICYFLEKKYDKSMPKWLFFGKDYGVGTSIEKEFSYTEGALYFKDNTATQDISKCKIYKYLFLNDYNHTLVLYQQPSENSLNKVVFHSFTKVNDRAYSAKEIEALMAKYSKKDLIEELPDQKFLGNWECVDKILESQVEGYTGERVCEYKPPYYSLGDLYSKLEIEKDGVHILGKEQDEIEIISKKGSNTLTYQNTKFPIFAKGDDFIIKNSYLSAPQKGLYKKIGNVEYLFLDVELEPDIDQEIYVYKKVN